MQIKDIIKREVERFEKRKLCTSGGSAFECSDYEGIVIDTEKFIKSSLSRVAKEAYRMGVKDVTLPEYDHTKCPLPESCIGYMNAESDLEHFKEELLESLPKPKVKKYICYVCGYKSTHRMPVGLCGGGVCLGLNTNKKVKKTE